MEFFGLSSYCSCFVQKKTRKKTKTKKNPRKLTAKVCLFVFIFFLVSPEEEAPVVLICYTTSPHPLRRFPVPRFRMLLEIFFTFICCLLEFHQAEISIAKDFNEGRYNVTRVRVEPESLRSWPP